MRWVLPSLDRGSKRGLDGGGDRGRRRRLQALVALAAAVLVMLGAVGVAQAAGTGSVEGTVTSHEGKELKEIEVAVVNAEGTKVGSTTTASNGEYAVEHISAGEYTVVFSDKTEIYLPKHYAVTVE